MAIKIIMKIRIDIPNFHDIIPDMIKRPFYLKQLSTATKRSPVTALLGPRQCGKTTLARMFSENKPAIHFDLESQPDLQRLQNPELMLGSLEGLVVLDEIQVVPELFNTLRVLVDRPYNQARFLILGSASPSIIRDVSETLAGRVEFVELSGFDLQETGVDSWQVLWLRGGFPRSFLADSDEDSLVWREGFIHTFLERDIPQLGITIPSAAMRRFWTMLAHYHGQTWNASELARSMGLSDKTVRSYLDILTGTFMVRQLQPWYENISKRQVKAPKIYFRDSGLLHTLLSLPDLHSLSGHPRVGASWEGFALEEVLRIIKPSEAFFWATHNGAEIDLFFLHRGRRYAVEAKFNEAPNITRTMRVALEDLTLDHLWIIYPGEHKYPVHEKITVWPLRDVEGLPSQIR
jgi:predicted AAA+ superfamily ATPase